MADEIIGMSDIARLCGVAPSTVRQWLRRAVLPAPAGRLGQRPYWHAADIAAWVAAGGAAPCRLGRPRGSRDKTARRA